MSIEMWLAFVLASAIVLMIPGPTILTVISYSVAHPKRVKLPLILAVTLGDSTALALSLLGLGALLAKSAFWFQVIKWCGGLYLIYLGIALLRSGIKPPAFQQDLKPTSRAKMFLSTYLVTALNPKGIVFFIAFLPQFISSSADSTQQLWLLAITFVALATLNATLYVTFAGIARQQLSSPSTQRVFNISGGTMLGAAGCWALTAKQL